MYIYDNRAWQALGVSTSFSLGGAGKPVGCSYVAHAIRTFSINHDIWAQALKAGVFGLKSF